MGACQYNRCIAAISDGPGGAADRVVDLYWDVPTEIPWQPTDRCAPNE